MSRLRHVDIFIEMLELGHDIMNEIRQQLIYYRASVYKDETARQIAAKIDQLQLLGELLNDEPTKEALTDYEALRAEGAMNCVPGECSFSKRVTLLLGGLDHAFKGLLQGRLSADAAPEQESEFADVVRQHRNKLLAACRHGSRQWAFFTAL
jgi:hypothetical protein